MTFSICGIAAKTSSNAFLIRFPQDIQFDTAGKYSGGYISCNLDPTFGNTGGCNFGPAYKIVYMPSSLTFSAEWDGNNQGHVGIRPNISGFTKEQFQGELNKIRIELAQ